MIYFDEEKEEEGTKSWSFLQEQPAHPSPPTTKGLLSQSQRGFETKLNKINLCYFKRKPQRFRINFDKERGK